MIAISEFSMGLPTLPTRVMGKTRADNLEQHREDFALIRAGQRTVQDVRDKYHPPEFQCRVHGLKHTAHPMSILCLHPRCLASRIVKAARRQGLMHRLMQLKDHHHWHDFIQYAAYRMCISARNDPLGSTQPNIKFLLSHFHRNLKTNYATTVSDRQTIELATDDRSIREMIEQEADDMVNSSDNATTILAIKQARQRFGSDLHFLSLAGELSALEVARIEAPQDQQVAHALALPDIQQVQRDWWRRQLRDTSEVRYGQA